MSDVGGVGIAPAIRNYSLASKKEISSSAIFCGPTSAGVVSQLNNKGLCGALRTRENIKPRDDLWFNRCRDRIPL